MTPSLGINIVDLGLVYGVVIGSENQVRLDDADLRLAAHGRDRASGADDPCPAFTDGVQINWVDAAVGVRIVSPDGREQLRASANV